LWAREGESSGAQGAPLLSPSPIINYNVIPNGVKRNEESLFIIVSLEWLFTKIQILALRFEFSKSLEMIIFEFYK